MAANAMSPPPLPATTNTAPPKRSLTPVTTTDMENQPPKPLDSPKPTVESSSPEPTEKSSTSTATVKDSSSDPAGLRHFISALDAAGSQRSALIKAVPGGRYYRCRAYYLQHKYSNFTHGKAKKAKATTQVKQTWATLSGTIPQDAFAKLLENFLTLQKQHGIFTSN